MSAFLTVLLFSTAGIASDLPAMFRIDRIQIEGTHDIRKKTVSSVLLIPPPSPWRFWNERPVASEDEVSDDAERMAQFYKSVGYYHADITYDIRITGDAPASTPTAHVTYHINEGTPVVVDSIDVDVEEQELPVPVEDLLRDIPLETGVRFEEKAYSESKQMIQKQFGAIGYFLAEVTGRALINASTNRASVTFSVVPGRLYYFGETTVIEDEPIVREKVLLRSRTYHTGEIYDTRKLDKSQRNLYNLDVFKAAVIQPGAPDPETGRVPISLELKPKMKQSIKLGIGFGNEDGLRLRAGWTYRNPFGRADRLTFEATRTDLLKKASAGYSQPYFWDERTALRTEAGALRETTDSYESNKVYGTARITRTIGYKRDLTAAYLLEYSEVVNFKLSDPRELAAYIEDHTFFVSSIYLEINRNTTDSETNPKNGSVITGSFEVASRLLGSELTYIKPSIELKKYIELPLGTVLAGRVRFETIFDPETNKEIPIYKRLFLGGANTVRGYGYQKLGPLDENGNPVGGQSSALANIEFRRPIVGILSGVLFLDLGMVDRDKLSYNLDEVRASAGAGLRLDTPIGPVRVDYGYQLNPPDFPDEGDGTSGLKMSRWQIHFSIGHAF